MGESPNNALQARGEFSGSDARERGRSVFLRRLDGYYAEAKRKMAPRLKPFGKYAAMAAMALSQQACMQYGLMTDGRLNVGEYSGQDRLRDSESLGRPSEIKKRSATERAMYGEKRFEDEWMWLNEGLYLPESAERAIKDEREEYANAKKNDPKTEFEPSLRSLLRPMRMSKDSVRPLVPEAIVRARPQEGFDVFFSRGLQPLVYAGEAGDGLRVDMRDVSTQGVPYWSADPVRGGYREAGVQGPQIAEGDELVKRARENMAMGEAVSRSAPQRRGGVGLRPWESAQRRDFSALMRVSRGGGRLDMGFRHAAPADWNMDKQVNALVYATLNPEAGSTALASVEALNEIQVGVLILADQMAKKPDEDPAPLAKKLVQILRATGFSEQAAVMDGALREAKTKDRNRKLSDALKAVQAKPGSETALQALQPDLYVGMSGALSANYVQRHKEAVVVSGMDLPPGMAMPSAALFAGLSDAELKAMALGGQADDGRFEKRLNEIKELKHQAIQRALQAYQSAVVERLVSQVGERKATEVAAKASYLFGKALEVSVFIRADQPGKAGKVVVVLRVQDPLLLVAPN